MNHSWSRAKHTGYGYTYCLPELTLPVNDDRPARIWAATPGLSWWREPPKHFLYFSLQSGSSGNSDDCTRRSTVSKNRKNCINFLTNLQVFLKTSVVDLKVLSLPDQDPSIIKQRVRKTLISTLLLRYFLFLKTDENVPSTSNNNIVKKTYFLLTSWKPLRERSGARSESQWYGTADPNLDPYQNVMYLAISCIWHKRSSQPILSTLQNRRPLTGAL